LERGIQLYTNENEVVFSPFNGIGSEGYQALKMNRKYIGIELKSTYFDVAKKNIEQEIQESNQMDIFDMLGDEERTTTSHLKTMKRQNETESVKREYMHEFICTVGTSTVQSLNQ